jgi:hypothetical protein
MAIRAGRSLAGSTSDPCQLASADQLERPDADSLSWYSAPVAAVDRQPSTTIFINACRSCVDIAKNLLTFMVTATPEDEARCFTVTKWLPNLAPWEPVKSRGASLAWAACFDYAIPARLASTSAAAAVFWSKKSRECDLPRLRDNNGRRGRRFRYHQC